MLPHKYHRWTAAIEGLCGLKVSKRILTKKGCYTVKPFNAHLNIWTLAVLVILAFYQNIFKLQFNYKNRIKGKNLSFFEDIHIQS